VNPFPPGTPEHDAYAAQTGINATHAVFHRWLGNAYDTGSLDAVLSVAATERLGGDPPWLLVVSGSGNAKTETVGSLGGVGAHITSTIASEGALLSATPAKEKTRGATGGLLRKVGDRGILVIKDFTSILSMNRDLRGSVLAALREVYDGRWERNVGTDGGKSLTWEGRIVVIGAVTTAYDAAHAVIAAMGDRFALVRVDSTTGRLAAGLQALANVDRETEMRAELSASVREVIDGMDPRRAQLSDADMYTLLAVANLVTFARTAVERDYQGNVIDAHAPEMPTRFAKMLGQIVRGGLAIGMEHGRALTTAVRVAGDSMPPLRLAILADLLAHPHSTTADVRKRLQRPHNTVDRELQALHLIGLLHQNKEEGQTGWRYVLSQQVDELALKALVSRNVSTQNVGIQEEHSRSSQETDKRVETGQSTVLVTDKPGNPAGLNGRSTTPTTPDAPLWPADDNCPGCGFGWHSHSHLTYCAGAR
jgi:predicted transcriptional regulator